MMTTLDKIRPGMGGIIQSVGGQGALRTDGDGESPDPMG